MVRSPGAAWAVVDMDKTIAIALDTAEIRARAQEGHDPRGTTAGDAEIGCAAIPVIGTAPGIGTLKTAAAAHSRAHKDRTEARGDVVQRTANGRWQAREADARIW